MGKGTMLGAVAAGVIISVILVYTVAPLFVDVTVDEAMPESNLTMEMGKFVGVGDGIHDATGDVLIVEGQDGIKYLRFENFEASNGPDLFVYLSMDDAASDFIDLGRLKGNIGNQNYMIPPGADLTNHDTVLIWCKQFSVLFGSAELS